MSKSDIYISGLCAGATVKRRQKTNTFLCPNVKSHTYLDRKKRQIILGGIQVASVVALAKVSSMSEQFIISQPLTLLVYGPRIKKAYSEHTEKGKQSTVRALNIQLARGDWGKVKLRASPSSYTAD